jgi:hypothetical protein
MFEKRTIKNCKQKVENIKSKKIFLLFYLAIFEKISKK